MKKITSELFFIMMAIYSVQHMLKVLQAGLFPSLNICDIETWGCWNVIYLLHFGFFLHVNCTVSVKLQVIYRIAIFRGDAELWGFLAIAKWAISLQNPLLIQRGGERRVCLVRGVVRLGSYG
jgi:hypothetical protein